MTVGVTIFERGGFGVIFKVFLLNCYRLSPVLQTPPRPLPLRFPVTVIMSTFHYSKRPVCFSFLVTSYLL